MPDQPLNIREMLPELNGIQLKWLKREIEARVNKTREIYLTKEQVASNDLGDDVIRHWDRLREQIVQDIEDWFAV